MDREHLQLIHDGENHWILTRCCNSQVQVCDSLRNTLNKKTKRSIRSLYAFSVQTDGTLPVSMLSVTKQGDLHSCGLYAIAYATDILAGISPTTSSYDVEKMRPHLIECLKQMKLDPFPKIRKRDRKIVCETIDVICI